MSQIQTSTKNLPEGLCRLRVVHVSINFFQKSQLECLDVCILYPTLQLGCYHFWRYRGEKSQSLRGRWAPYQGYLLYSP